MCNNKLKIFRERLIPSLGQGKYIKHFLPYNEHPVFRLAAAVCIPSRHITIIILGTDGSPHGKLVASPDAKMKIVQSMIRSCCSSTYNSCEAAIVPPIGGDEGQRQIQRSGSSGTTHGCWAVAGRTTEDATRRAATSKAPRARRRRGWGMSRGGCCYADTVVARR